MLWSRIAPLLSLAQGGQIRPTAAAGRHPQSVLQRIRRQHQTNKAFITYVINATDLQADTTALEGILAEDALLQRDTSKVQARVVSCSKLSVTTSSVGCGLCLGVLYQEKANKRGTAR
jgi:primosomal protein N''